MLGKGRAIVVKTGSSTAIGDIHKSITSQISDKTPLKRKLDEFGDLLAKVDIIYIRVYLSFILDYLSFAYIYNPCRLSQLFVFSCGS